MPATGATSGQPTSPALACPTAPPAASTAKPTASPPQDRRRLAAGESAVRAEVCAAQAEAGNVILLDDTPCRRWIEEWTNWSPSRPPVRSVDATPGALNKLAKGFSAVPVTGGGGSSGSQRPGTQRPGSGGANAQMAELARASGLRGGTSGGGLPGMPGGSLQGMPGGL